MAGVALLAAGALAQASPRAVASHALMRCFSAQLTVVLGRPGAALGHAGSVVSFRNGSATACTLHGYPALQMLDAAGHRLRTQVLHGIAYTVPRVPERVATVKPGGEASFDLG